MTISFSQQQYINEAVASGKVSVIHGEELDVTELKQLLGEEVLGISDDDLVEAVAKAALSSSAAPTTEPIDSNMEGDDVDLESANKNEDNTKQWSNLKLPHYLVRWKDGEGSEHITIVMVPLCTNKQSGSLSTVIDKGGKGLTIIHEWSSASKFSESFSFGGAYAADSARSTAIQARLDSLMKANSRSIQSVMKLRLPFRVDENFYISKGASKKLDSVGTDFIGFKSNDEKFFVIELIKTAEGGKVNCLPAYYETEYAGRGSKRNTSDDAQNSTDDAQNSNTQQNHHLMNLD